MDPQKDPKIDPERLILGDPCQKLPPGSLHGPSKIHIGEFFYTPQDNGLT